MGQDISSLDLGHIASSEIGDSHPNYDRFVPASEAIKLMKTASMTARRLRSEAHKTLNKEMVGFRQGYHFKDVSQSDSFYASLRFCPRHCDEFFARPVDERTRPYRGRRKAS